MSQGISAFGYRYMAHIYSCSGCDFTNANLTLAKNHINNCQNSHLVTNLHCDFCGKSLSSQKRLINHLKTCTTFNAGITYDSDLIDFTSNLQCYFCEKQLQTERGLKMHFNKCTEKPDDTKIDNSILSKIVNLQCYYCVKQLLTQKGLKMHMKTCKTRTEYYRVEQSDKQNNYIYIIREREFIKSNEKVYKLGFTTQPILNRFKSYPKESEICVCVPVVGNPELIIINQFKLKFIHRSDIGNEYFEGTLMNMFNELKNLI